MQLKPVPIREAFSQNIPGLSKSHLDKIVRALRETFNGDFSNVTELCVVPSPISVPGPVYEEDDIPAEYALLDIVEVPSDEQIVRLITYSDFNWPLPYRKIIVECKGYPTFDLVENDPELHRRIKLALLNLMGSYRQVAAEYDERAASVAQFIVDNAQ